ncbi:MAG: type IX secretion system membrane protein PorP/SprF [Bacteroides sp.]|nr:type IX secretion system membrane protein PorP/SprF [Bacteroides sp.]MDE7189809.1 type IX secretion system membrane protein PorP/SprF [Muribaculaceae bacterium]
MSPNLPTLKRIGRTTLGRLLYATGVMLTLLLPAAARAQSDPQFTQYWAIPAYYNPAVAGSTDWIRIRGGAKLQWVGIENAPQSFIAAADSPFRIGAKRFGAGINFTQESLGLFKNILLNAQLSYNFKLFGGRLAIGVQGGYLTTKFKGSEVYIPDDDDYHNGSDTAIPNKDLAGNTFDISAGLNFTHRLFWVGLSGLHLLNPTVQMSLEGSDANDAQEYETEMARMLYLIAGSNIELNNTLFTLQPSVMVKTDLNTFTPEVTLRATYNKFITFGAGYRLNEAVSVMIGAEYKNFFLGYAYDYPLSAISKASSGSHEIVAGYQLKLDFSGKNRNRQRSIRIM